VRLWVRVETEFNAKRDAGECRKCAESACGAAFGGRSGGGRQTKRWRRDAFAAFDAIKPSEKFCYGNIKLRRNSLVNIDLQQQGDKFR
jgi:hypothetical protein